MSLLWLGILCVVFLLFVLASVLLEGGGCCAGGPCPGLVSVMALVASLVVLAVYLLSRLVFLVRTASALASGQARAVQL